MGSNRKRESSVEGAQGNGESSARGPASAAETAELSELMARYVSGDSGAFSALFEVLHGRLYGFHLWASRDREHAEDLTQMTFLKLHVARRRYRIGSPVLPWVFTIAKNLQRDLFRKRRRSREQLTEAGRFQDGQLADPRAASPADVLLQRKLEVAIQSLPGGQRDVVVLHKLAQLSMQEVASSLGISLSAAKVRAHRAYASLRRYLGEEGE